MVISEKHKQILFKAEELFALKGFEGTTVRDIADAAGINLAMISYYFGSKERLMEALFTERMGSMKLKVEALINNQSLTPWQKVKTLVDEYLLRVLEKQSFYKVMICEQVINKNSVVLNQLKELKLSYAKLIGELIREGQEKKQFRKDIDVMLMLNTMTGTSMQVMLNKAYYKDFNGLKKMKASEFDQLLIDRLRTHILILFKAILGYEE